MALTELRPYQPKRLTNGATDQQLCTLDMSQMAMV
jgi:hypothetical protein